MSLPLTKRIEALGRRMLKAQFGCACVLLVALSRDSRDGAWQRFYVVSCVVVHLFSEEQLSIFDVIYIYLEVKHVTKLMYRSNRSFNMPPREAETWLKLRHKKQSLQVGVL